MSNGWTGGQYSLYRAIFGGYLCLWLVPSGRAFSSRAEAVPPDSLSPLVRLFPNVLAVVDAPWAITALLVIATGLAVLLAIGRFDRLAAFGLLYVGACFMSVPS